MRGETISRARMSTIDPAFGAGTMAAVEAQRHCARRECADGEDGHLLLAALPSHFHEAIGFA